MTVTEPTPVFGNSDQFGISVAIDGNYAVIGQQHGNKAFVFERSGNTWTLQATLTPTATTTILNGSGFGRAVHIENDQIVVGAHEASVSGVGPVGAIFVFTRSGSTWSQEDATSDFDTSHNLDDLGISVAISGNTVVAGSTNGDVITFKRGGGTCASTQWCFEQNITSTSDTFGLAVDIEGDTLVIGDTQTSSDPGSAYVYRRTTSWSLQATLAETGGSANDDFGDSVVIDGTWVVVGAPGDDNLATNSGAVFVYAFRSPHLVEKAKLDAGLYATTGLGLGTSVGLNGVFLAAGASGGSDDSCFFFTQGGGPGQWFDYGRIVDGGTTCSVSGDWGLCGDPSNGSTLHPGQVEFVRICD